MSIQEIQKVTPDELHDLIVLSIKAKRSLYIHGAPGIGKSAIVKQAVKRACAHLHEFRTCYQDAVDVRGFPYRTADNKQAYSVPEAYPDPASKDLHVIFLDEFAQGTPLVTNSWSQAILDGQLAEYHFPENTVFIAASNRAKDRANTNRVGTHLNNRFTHVELVVDVEQWLAFAFENNYHESVIAYIANQHKALSDFDKDSVAFPSPRAWEIVSDYANVPGITRDQLAIATAGTVGQGYGSEFIAHLDIWHKLPRTSDIVADPHGTPLPDFKSGEERIGFIYIVLTSLVKSCQKAPENFDPAYAYLSRFNSREHLELAQRLAFKLNPKVAETTSYIQHHVGVAA